MAEDMDKPSSNSQPTDKPEHWERELLQRLAFASLNEQRRARRWGYLFKFVIVLYLFALLFIANPDLTDWLQGDLMASEHTALVEVNGTILAGEPAGADYVVTGLRNAFSDENTKGVILRINSPGGSAVQSGYINDEIHRLREKYPEIPIYAVITDICASGGYYIAAATEQIYADKSSLVGSIGVIMGSFGFVDAIEKLGVERRLITSGEHKALLDPFSPEDPSEKQHLQSVLDNIHAQFIQAVKTGRGDRLNPEADLFSGLVWTGEQALALGLVDELGSSSYVAREIFAAENIVDFTPEPNYWEELAGRLGTVIMRNVVQQLHMESATLQ